MKLLPLKKTLASLTMLAAVVPLAVACGTDASTETSSTGTTTSSTTDSTTGSTTDSTTDSTGSGTTGTGRTGGPGAVDVSSVTTEAQLIALVQSAYGEASLGLHRGHQPVEDVLDTVLGISHDELHVRMEEQGQNLAAVATDLGIDPQTLIDALVDSWSPAIDNAVAAGSITEDQAADYLTALETAFTFRVTWNGTDATPSFTGVDV